MIYERRHVPPIPPLKFAVRMARHTAAAAIFIAFSLGIGMAGYHALERMSWLDAFLNASMILGGMGPVKTEGLSEAGKLFAGCYALYSGLAFIAVTGLLLAPVVHRVLHHFHWEGERSG
jgi:hypothetical protein